MNNIKEQVAENRQEAINLLKTKANGGEIIFTEVDFEDEEKFFDLMEEKGEDYGQVLDDCPMVVISTDWDSCDLLVVYVLSVKLIDNDIEFTAFCMSDNYGMDIDDYHIYDCEFLSDNNLYDEIAHRLG